MDIAGLSIPYNYSVGSLLHVIPEVTYPALAILFIGSLVGTVGNILIILAVLLRKSLHQLGNYFVVNLAIADLCLTTCVDPFSIVSIFRGEIFFLKRQALCAFIASLCLTACYCSLLTVGAIAINRYIHICHSSAYNRIFTKRSTIATCVALWIVSFLMEFPNFVGWGNHIYDVKNLMCLWDRLASRSYTIFFSFVAVLLPCTVIVVCYARIFVFIRVSVSKVRNLVESGAQSQASSFNSIRLAKTLFLIFAVLVVCWTPFTFIVVFDHDDHLPIHVHAYCVLLAHSNSTINFAVYGLTNREFSRGYAMAFNRVKAFFLRSNRVAVDEQTISKTY